MVAIAHPKLRQLYDYWSAKRGDRRMPSRAEIDPLDLGFVLGNVILLEVIAGDPPRFRIRVHGTNLVQRAGYELTGKMLDELPTNDFREAARQSFSWVVRRREPYCGRHERVIDGRLQRFETVMMPLSRGGETVDMILVGLIYDDERR